MDRPKRTKKEFPLSSEFFSKLYPRVIPNHATASATASSPQMSSPSKPNRALSRPSERARSRRRRRSCTRPFLTCICPREDRIASAQATFVSTFNGYSTLQPPQAAGAPHLPAQCLRRHEFRNLSLSLSLPEEVRKIADFRQT